MVWLTQALFYGLPWLQWNDRPAVLFDLAARRFYIFDLVLYPQDFIYLTGLLIVSAYALFFFTAVAGRLWWGGLRFSRRPLPALDGNQDLARTACLDWLHPDNRHTPTRPTMNTVHYAPRSGGDRFALLFVRLLRFFADAFFAKRYGHRAIVLETVAAVPGMVGATLTHLRCLRRMEEDRGWIRTLMDEAENERMHLMTFIEIAKPNWFERVLVLLVQGFFYNAYFLLYLLAPATAHRVVGYFEEEACRSYTNYLELIDAGLHENVPAPDIAKRYWNLPANARLRDVVLAVRADEEGHRDVNHGFADEMLRRQPTAEAVLHQSCGA